MEREKERDMKKGAARRPLARTLHAPSPPHLAPPFPTLHSRTGWVCITATGHKTSFISDKRGIIQRFNLGVPIRDMRLMDAAPGGATLGDAAFILVRDNAAVVCIAPRRPPRRR